MPRVTIEGHATVDATAGETLLSVCVRSDVPMESACGGFAGCNSCRVRVLSGADQLTRLLPEEEPFLERPGQRLGCQACVKGDVAIRLEPGM